METTERPVRGRPARQERSTHTRERIAEAAVRVMAERGLAGLTHRGVAALARTPLAATTYYFETKDDILAEASNRILAGYVAAFRRAEARMRGGPGGPAPFRALTIRLAANAAGPHRTGALAWCEIILDAARREETRALARTWFDRTGEAWSDIARVLGLEEPEHKAGAGVEIVIGLILIACALGLSPEQVRRVLEDGADPLVVWRPAGGAPDEAAQPEPAGRKAAATRERILTAAIDLLTEQGPGGVGYRTVAECAGLTITAPAYYFRTIGDLLAAAQTRLFAASKARYRQGVSGADYSAIDLAGLIDLTAVIFLREATEYGAANVAGFSLWLEAARHPALRPTVWSAVEDQSRAWSRLLSRLSPSPRPIDGLLLQCLFLGKLVRITATGAETPDLAAVRGAFARDIAAIIEDRFWL
ncbi:TetR/AcrR family transcriptional regulator [Brevundimonas mediterranea]|uniref:HTH tetR-type domain-containing protein n=1 Tax=Brevundimonas mediterranea TaxID=74329 RepID=A0A7Z8Y124_9CAUL|nr:TetR family transcriptional regulator [Brevundimonas mediterranea]VDC48760.1 hypothetical protein BREV_BREV_03296 [Brevundimonas mediterranea]